MYKLVIEDDEGNKTVVPVIRDEISIGRQDGSTIRLTERNVSRQHAKLVRENDHVYLEELSARYGVRKNGEKISGRQPFTVGDVFLIGDYRLTLLAEGAAAEAAAKAAAEAAAAAAAAAAPAPAPAPLQPPPSGGFSNAPTQITSREEIERRSHGTEILPAQPAKLVVVSSNFAGQEFPLANKEMVIGRADDCDIIVDHRSVSQKHAKVVREATGNYKIVDLNSKNGVKVSGEDYRAVHLKRGDIVELGHVKFRFVEPGENYVFTPQSIIEDDADVATSSGGNKNVLIGIGVVLIVGAVIVAAVMSMKGGENAQSEPVADNVPVTNTAAPSVSAILPQLERASVELREGHAGNAITILELSRDTMNPTPEERAKIDEMLSEARREKPLEEALKDGQKYFRDGRYVDALRQLKKIPPGTSIMRSLMDREDLAGKVIEQILAQANAALLDGDRAQASQMVDEVLLYEPQNAAALELKTQIDSKPIKVANVTNPKVQDATKTPKETTPATTKSKELTPEEIEERAAEAQKMIFAGDHQGAIKACWGVKDAKCYRIVGAAYKSLGEIEKSCASFKKAGMTPPHCQ